MGRRRISLRAGAAPTTLRSPAIPLRHRSPARHWGSHFADQQALSRRRLGGRAYRYGRTPNAASWRSEEHTSELQSLMRISYAVFCLKKKKHQTPTKKKNNRQMSRIEYSNKIIE